MKMGSFFQIKLVIISINRFLFVFFSSVSWQTSERKKCEWPDKPAVIRKLTDRILFRSYLATVWPNDGRARHFRCRVCVRSFFRAHWPTDHWLYKRKRGENKSLKEEKLTENNFHEDQMHIFVWLNLSPTFRSVFAEGSYLSLIGRLCWGRAMNDLNTLEF